MAQDTNHLLQDSYTDLLETSNGHTYDGIFPVNVNNDNDTISLDPIAKTVIEPTNTVFVETDTNLAGNTVYKLHVSHDAGKSYDGVYPVQVDNNRNEISVNNVNLDLQWPMFGEVDNDTLTLGTKLGNYYSDNDSNEINYMEYWNDENSDKFIRLRHDGNINPVSFGFTMPEMPPSGNGTYYFGADRHWHSKTYYKYGDVYTTKSVSPSTTTFYVTDIIQLAPKQEIEGVLYIGNTTLDISTGNSQGNVKLIYDDGSENVIAKTDVNFDWGYNYGNEIVIPFYYKNPENRNISLELRYDTGSRIANPSTLQIRFNGWIM